MAALAACGSSPAPAPENRAPVGAGIALDAELGWLGIAPVDKREPGDWRVEGPATVYLPARPAKAARPVTFTAVDTQGATAQVIGAGEQQLPYGCDDGRLDAIALDPIPGARARLAPGVVWVLPTSAPASWVPRPIGIRAAAASETRRRYTAGPLVFELERVADRKGTLAITWNGRPVYTRPFERDERTGGETTPIDLAGHGVGVIEPIAAWQIVDGAILVAFAQPSYEGLHVHAALVTPTAGATRDDVGFYLYQCAF
jgi:hypothetical protein